MEGGLNTWQLCVVSFCLGAVLPSIYLLLPSTQPLLLQPPATLASGVVAGGGQQQACPYRPPSAELCVDPAFAVDGVESDWNRVKAVPPLARCTVQGFPIERLEPSLNFHRAYSLGFVTDVEDKTHLLPFLRASHDLCLAARKRRVLLDMGGRQFDSSVTWFLRNYPLEFSEIYVFEAWKGRFVIPPHSPDPELEVVSTLNNMSRVALGVQRGIPNQILDRIHLREEYVNVLDKAPSTNISRVMREELGLTPDDTVIVKMDIEWAEWSVLPVWLEDKEMPLIVDELFVEVHYQHPTMFPSIWNKGPPRKEALQLYQSLRDRGFYAHAWP